jgi:hypothetical protein
VVVGQLARREQRGARRRLAVASAIFAAGVAVGAVLTALL